MGQKLTWSSGRNSTQEAHHLIKGFATSVHTPLVKTKSPHPAVIALQCRWSAKKHCVRKKKCKKNFGKTQKFLKLSLSLVLYQLTLFYFLVFTIKKMKTPKVTTSKINCRVCLLVLTSKFIKPPLEDFFPS